MADGTRRGNREAITEDRPPLRVSVVVPTYGRPARLDRCLAALARQDLGRSFEVVVVDDGGPEPLDDLVAGHRGTLAVTLVRQRNAGPAAARNAGAARASGRVLAFTDDDCEPDVGWLTALVTEIERHPGAMVGGRTVNALTGNVYAEASQSIVSYLEVAADSGRESDLDFLTTNNIALEAEGFARSGGFDSLFPSAAAEDRDFCDRWRSAGGTQRRVADAVVRHHHDMGLPGFWRQHVGYGRGACCYHDLRASRGQPALRVEPPRFYVEMLRFPFAGMPPPRAVPVAALVGLSQVATAVGFTLERHRASAQRDTRAA